MNFPRVCDAKDCCYKVDSLKMYKQHVRNAVKAKVKDKVKIKNHLPLKEPLGIGSRADGPKKDANGEINRKARWARKARAEAKEANALKATDNAHNMAKFTLDGDDDTITPEDYAMLAETLKPENDDPLESNETDIAPRVEPATEVRSWSPQRNTGLSEETDRSQPTTAAQRSQLRAEFISSGPWHGAARTPGAAGFS